MPRFIEGQDLQQVALIPECLDDFIADDNPVRIIDAFVDELNLESLGFEKAAPAATGRPSFSRSRRPNGRASSWPIPALMVQRMAGVRRDALTAAPSTARPAPGVARNLSGRPLPRKTQNQCCSWRIGGKWTLPWLAGWLAGGRAWVISIWFRHTSSAVFCRRAILSDV